MRHATCSLQWLQEFQVADSLTSISYITSHKLNSILSYSAPLFNKVKDHHVWISLRPSCKSWMRHLKDGKKQGPYEPYIDNTGLDHTWTSNEPGTKQREDRDKNVTRKGQDMEKTVN